MRLPLLALASSALLAASAHAQQVATAPAPTAAAATSPGPAAHFAAPELRTRPDTVQAFKDMVSSLMNLAIAQEGHYADHGTYTTDARALGINGKNQRAYAQVIFAGGRSWTAMATFPGLRGKSCVAFAGDAEQVVKLPATQTDRRTPTATQEAQPICDYP